MSAVTHSPDAVRRRLESERSRLEAIRADLRSDLEDEEASQGDEHRALDIHAGETGTDVEGIERDQSILESVEGELGEVLDALSRLESGTYGACEVDGGPIGDERLEAVPTARRCAEHQGLADRAD